MVNWRVPFWKNFLSCIGWMDRLFNSNTHFTSIIAVYLWRDLRKMPLDVDKVWSPSIGFRV